MEKKICENCTYYTAYLETGLGTRKISDPYCEVTGLYVSPHFKCSCGKFKSKWHS